MSPRVCRGLILTALALLHLPLSARPTVGLLLKARSSNGFWSAVEQGAKAAADANDVELVVKGPNEVGNVGLQVKLLEALAAQKLDAIVVTPLDMKSLLAPLQNAAARGIKIVVAETAPPADSGLPFVGYDPEKLATSAAEAFAALVNDGEEVSIFRGGPHDKIIVQRDQIILARLRELRPNLRVHQDFFAVTNEEGSTATKAGLMLEKHPESKLFIATSSVSTLAILGAVKARNVASVRVAGFGSNLVPETAAAIENGILLALVAQVPREIGHKGVATAVALIRGETVPPKTDVPFHVITRENFQTPAIQALKEAK